MRFRFCGDLDCPDWVLAEISTLSKLVSEYYTLNLVFDANFVYDRYVFALNCAHTAY